MKLNSLRLATAVALCGAAVSAQAATMTLSGYKYGNGNSVNASAPVYSGGAGGFVGTLTGAGFPFDTSIGGLNTYCVELGEFFSPGTSYTNYNVVTATSYFNASKALQLAKLLTYANPQVTSAGAGLQDDASTSLQLAIWNIVYDNDATLSGGLFSDTSIYAAQANSFLLNSASAVNSLQVFVLKSQTGVPTGSTGQQDQLMWIGGGGPTAGNIPEPTSLALAFGALGALGFSARRRRPTKA
jgi:Thioester domain/PEP-CTERM motif